MANFEKPEANDTAAAFWSKDEEKRLLGLADDDDYTLTEVAEQFDGRTRQAVKNKLRKLRKARGEYNYLHYDDKYNLSLKWIEQIDDEISGDIKAIDGYAGVGKSAEIYLDYVDILECCEIEEDAFQRLVANMERFYGSRVETDTPGLAKFQGEENSAICYNDNINDLLHRKVGNKEGDYQFIDLDPCGSPFVSVPQSIRLIEDGYLAVTYGDLQLQRWGRYAPLMKAYRMPQVETFEEVIEYMIGWTMFEGVRQENSVETRKLEVLDLEMLSEKNTGVVRVLYKVKKTRKLAPVLNYLEDTLIGFDGESNPVEARYDLSGYTI